MIDKIKHHRAYVSFLKFLKLLMIPTMQEIGGISKGHILTAYQNGSVNVSKLKIPINSKPQKEVAINTGRCITILIIPWTRNEFLLSFIFSQISYTMCAYYSSYICNVGQFVKFLFTVLFIASFAFVLQRHRAKPIPLVGRGFTPAAFSFLGVRHGGSKPPPYDIPHYKTNRQRKQVLCRNHCAVYFSAKNAERNPCFF